MNQCDKVLSDLKANPRGIVAYDYLPGFPIRSRISDLRAKGHNITGKKDSFSRLTRYKLEDRQ